MNKLLSIAVLLAVTVCSCHGSFDRRSIRSATTEVSVNADDPIDTIASRDSAAADTFDVFTGNIIISIKLQEVSGRFKH